MARVGAFALSMEAGARRSGDRSAHGSSGLGENMLEKRPSGADAASESGQRRSMKIVSKVLLGTVAGCAILGARAHAADLGEKSEPVQFVRICSLDGHSYSYIPGNNACTKNALSLTIGTDDRRSKSLMSLTTGAPKVGDQPVARWPDPFISLRTDQAWGYGALVGGAHNLSATYTGDNSALNGLGACLQSGAVDCVGPRDKAGLFVGVGGELKVPIFGAGDRIGAGVHFSQGGSSGFGGGGLDLSTPGLFGAGNNSAVTRAPDVGAGLELTSAWSVQAGYDHQWSPSMNTSLFAAYSNMSYDADTAGYLASACGGAAAPAAANCKSNWGNVGAGLRTSWAPANGLTLSVQTMYNYAWSGFAGNGNLLGSASGVHPADGSNFANQGVWSSYLRINRSFGTGD
jgi:hypothetical protein